jgi:hypothetical protein
LPLPFNGTPNQEPPLSGDDSALPFSPGRNQNPIPLPGPDSREGDPGKQAGPPSINPLTVPLPATPPSAPTRRPILPWETGAVPEAGMIIEGPAYPVVEEPHDWYPKGDYTFQALVGYYKNVSSSTNYSYAPIDLRIGKILDCGCHEGILRGYFEPILEIEGAPTFGIGHAFVGANALLRYNFVQAPTGYGCERCRLVPYIQVGVGLQYNDAYRDNTQSALGQALEYTLEAQVGVHYFLTHSLSLDVEGGYQMITNLGQSSNNGGINAVGGSVGFTYYFPSYCCRR